MFSTINIMKSASLKQKKKIQQKILSWYKKNKRDLPWRKTTDPYAILVSEMMLQQTQVDRVLSKYKAWLQEFPTMQHLARAPPAVVLRCWSGLGYNRRALHLQKAAQIIVEKYHGEFPQTSELLRALPGIGPYTSHSLLIFAYNQDEVTVDTN